MRSWLLSIAIAGLLVIPVPKLVGASDLFSQRLTPDQQIIHALNRLTFGPRPGDVEEVGRLGVKKWIELQLHPERMAESSTLDERLKPLTSLRMTPTDIIRDFTPLPQPPLNITPSITTLLSQEETRKVLNGTAEERLAVLKALDPEKRMKVLAVLPANAAQSTPEFQKEAEDARKAQQQEIQKELRRRNPQLNDLLSPTQVTAAQSGNRERLEALFAELGAEKSVQVAGLLPDQRLIEFPDLHRQGKMKKDPRRLVIQDPKEAKVYRAIYSNRQLEEVLVDFWFNHFNVNQDKNPPQAQTVMPNLIASYERDAIRPHVLGHFKDLLLATARHPAMLYYLDNWESMASGTLNVGPFAPQRGTVNGVANAVLPTALSRLDHGLNENYGRELMELHTLGVHGGYTQADVTAVARCLTGWTVRDPIAPEFVFAPFMHDPEEKTVLGHKFPAGGGENDGLEVLDLLAHHPSTAKFISRELAQRFVADDPPDALVERMAKTFTKTDGDLRAVLETMFNSPEFFSEGAWQAKIKSPFEMVISAVRAMGAEVLDASTLVQKIADLGQPLYTKLEPTGYPNTGDIWLSTTGTMGRISFAAGLPSVSGVKVDPARLQGKDGPAIARELLGRDASPQTQTALRNGLEHANPTATFVASIVLGSPDFQRR